MTCVLRWKDGKPLRYLFRREWVGCFKLVFLKEVAFSEGYNLVLIRLSRSFVYDAIVIVVVLVVFVPR